MEAVCEGTAATDEPVQIGGLHFGISHGANAVVCQVIRDQEEEVGPGLGAWQLGGAGDRRGGKKCASVHRTHHNAERKQLRFSFVLAWL